MKKFYKWGFWILLTLFLSLLTIINILFSRLLNPKEISSINKQSDGSSPSGELMSTVSATKKSATDSSEFQNSAEISFKHRCTNDLHGFSLQYNQELFPEYQDEGTRCMNFSLTIKNSSKEDKHHIIPIKLNYRKENIDDVAAEIASSLTDATTSSSQTEFGFKALRLMGTWPAESSLSGTKHFAILVENSMKGTLIFEIQNVTTEYQKIMEELANFVKFL